MIQDLLAALSPQWEDDGLFKRFLDSNSMGSSRSNSNSNSPGMEPPAQGAQVHPSAPLADEWDGDLDIYTSEAGSVKGDLGFAASHGPAPIVPPVSTEKATERAVAEAKPDPNRLYPNLEPLLREAFSGGLPNQVKSTKTGEL